MSRPTSRITHSNLPHVLPEADARVGDKKAIRTLNSYVSSTLPAWTPTSSRFTSPLFSSLSSFIHLGTDRPLSHEHSCQYSYLHSFVPMSFHCTHLAKSHLEPNALLSLSLYPSSHISTLSTGNLRALSPGELHAPSTPTASLIRPLSRSPLTIQTFSALQSGIPSLSPSL